MSTTWKQVVYDVADAWREANDSTAKIPVSELPNKVKEGGENIDPELTTLEGTLQEILEILPFKGAMASGQYVWKKLTAEGGDLVEYVISNDPTAYPDGGTQEGFWYELFDPLTLIAENIREGVDIWGVIGTMVEGVTGVEYGEIAISSATAPITIKHKIAGAKFAVLMPVKTTTANYEQVLGFVSNGGGFTYGSTTYSNFNVHKYDTIARVSGTQLTDTTATFASSNCYGSTRNFSPGTYRWVVMA